MNCICCKNELYNFKLNEYFLCPMCNSYSYISEKTAEEDNSQYFNDIFSTNKFEYSEKKKKIFFHYSKLFNKKNKDYHINYNMHIKELNNSFEKNKTILEIGFGAGYNLSNLLKRNINCYGVDLSEVAVENFKNKYPEHKDKVFTNINIIEKKFDIVYCSALFEHIDKPDQLLDEISKKLNKNGLFIIDGLPILNNNISTINKEYDINFWKPCHRIIYSEKGLCFILNKHNFILEKKFEYETFNYRVLSLHKKYNFKIIDNLRDSTIKNNDLPDLKTYKKICKEALKINTLALYGCFWFKRIV